MRQQPVISVLVVQAEPNTFGAAIKECLAACPCVEILAHLPAKSTACFDVRVAVSYAEATALAAAVPPPTFDVVLLDLLLPNGQGADVARQTSALYPNTPIIVLTRLDDPEHVREAMTVPAVRDYLVLGQFDTRQLLRAIAHALTLQDLTTMFEGIKAVADAAGRLASLAHPGRIRPLPLI